MWKDGDSSEIITVFVRHCMVRISFTWSFSLF